MKQPSSFQISLRMLPKTTFDIEQKVIAFSADNCAANFGSLSRGGENNAYYLLKQWKPKLIGIGYACHIAHNGLKTACDSLPIDIECIIVKIYSYFHIYTVRIERLKNICADIEGLDYSQLLGYASSRF